MPRLCENTEAERTAIICYCDTRGLSRTEVLQKVYELKK